MKTADHRQIDRAPASPPGFSGPPQLAASFLQALAIVLLFLRKYRGVLSRLPLPRINLLVLIPRREDLENKHWTLISLKGHAGASRNGWRR